MEGAAGAADRRRLRCRTPSDEDRATPPGPRKDGGGSFFWRENNAPAARAQSPAGCGPRAAAYRARYARSVSSAGLNTSAAKNASQWASDSPGSGSNVVHHSTNERSPSVTGVTRSVAT